MGALCLIYENLRLNTPRSPYINALTKIDKYDYHYKNDKNYDEHDNDRESLSCRFILCMVNHIESNSK